MTDEIKVDRPGEKKKQSIYYTEVATTTTKM